MKKSTFVKVTKRIFIGTFVLFIISYIALFSYESSINKKTQDIRNDIAAVQSDIDSLSLQKQNLTAFSKIQKVATAKGYKYADNTATAYSIDNEAND